MGTSGSICSGRNVTRHAHRSASTSERKTELWRQVAAADTPRTDTLPGSTKPLSSPVALHDDPSSPPRPQIRPWHRHREAVTDNRLVSGDDQRQSWRITRPLLRTPSEIVRQFESKPRDLGTAPDGSIRTDDQAPQRARPFPVFRRSKVLGVKRVEVLRLSS